MSRCIAFALTLLLCTVAQAAEEPKWLKDARAREGKSLQAGRIESKDGWFSVATPGKLVGTVEKVDGIYSIELDVGGDTSVHCVVYPEGIDLANSLRVTFEHMIKAIEASEGKIEARALESTDAGAYGAVPYIALSWLYSVKGPQGVLVGGLKQLVMEKGGHGVVCLHDDLGYTRTFAAVTRAIADSLQTREPAGAPHYVEIATASMSGAKIGVAVTTLERDAEGDTRAMQMTALLLATEDGAVRSEDSTDIHWLRPDGTLINAASTSISNGELSADLSLTAEDEAWVVEGRFQGKEVRTTLPPGAEPGNWVVQARQLRALLAQPDAAGREHRIDLWIEDNPAELTEFKTTLVAKQGDDRYTARGDFGGIAVDLTLDSASGMTAAADLDLGPVRMKIERVYVSGEF